MDSTTWLAMSRSGQPIGTMDSTMSTLQSGIRQGLRAIPAEKCSAVGSASMDRTMCDLHTGPCAHRRTGPNLSGSGAPRTVRNNLFP